MGRWRIRSVPVIRCVPSVTDKKAVRGEEAHCCACRSNIDVGGEEAQGVLEHPGVIAVGQIERCRRARRQCLDDEGAVADTLRSGQVDIRLENMGRIYDVMHFKPCLGPYSPAKVLFLGRNGKKSPKSFAGFKNLSTFAPAKQKTGCSSVGLECRSGGPVVAGSSPVIPTSL